MFKENQSAVLQHSAFGGHETFPLRYTWLHKAVREVDADAEVFAREDALVRFGVGKNMVRAIRHWAMVCGVLEDDPVVPRNRGRVLRVTELGRHLLGKNGWDPYMEDPGTLWILQWRLGSQPNAATTWFWVFNLVPQPEFTRESLLKWLEALAAQKGWTRAATESIRRDIDCFIRTYVPVNPSRSIPIEDSLDCPLVDLGLLREFGSRGSYLLARDEQPSLPDEIFAYALLSFLAQQSSTARTIPIETLAFAPGSPGRIFCLTENGVVSRLEKFDRLTDGAVTYDDTAGMRQMLIKDLPEPMRLLSKYYDPKRVNRRGNKRAA
jgi:hypothetical protein